MKTQYSDGQGTTSGGDTITPALYVANVAQGTIVYKVGAKTYKTSGEVTSTNYNTTSNGVSFSNLTKTKAHCEEGDSGGLVYMYHNGSYKPVGIVKGYGSTLFSTFSVYVKASEVVSQMSVYPY